MDKTGWTTHCFGRFLVDLPPQVEVRAAYKIWGDEIKRLYETPTSLATTLNKREQELKAKKHETEGDMFIRRIEHDGRSTSLLSWYSKNSKRGMLLESYLVSKPDWQAFQNNGEVSPSKEQSAIGIADKLANNIRSRAPNEIPTGPGFCIDGGFIAGNAYQSEEFLVGVKFPDHPDVNFDIMASTGAAENRLLERMNNFFQTEVAGPVTGIKTLRKGQRNVGPIQAEEYLIAASDQGQRVYSFAWESQGKDESLAEPSFSVGLGVLERDTDDAGNPPPPAFKSDEQALELWDAIIESIRLRPGAA